MATLIVRPDKIGDLILSFSVVEAIKSKYPDEKIYYITSKYAEDVIKNHPKIDGHISIDDKTKTKEIIRFLKENDINRAIILFPNFKISLAIKLSGIKEVIFPGFRIYQFMFKNVVYPRRSKAEKKEWEYNIDIAKRLFPDIEYTKPKLYLTEEEIEIGKKIISKYKKPVIGIYPGGGKELRWPLEKFKKLIEKIENMKLTIVVLLGPNERNLVSEFKEWYIGKELTLRELMATIKEMDLFITNNTGPMHIRGVFEKPMIQIFDPRKAVNPKRWGYEYKGAYLVKPQIDPCNGNCKSCKYYNCMNTIEVEEIVKLIKTWQEEFTNIQP
ncbi:MAG: glycosyltransferase family 9 protein [Thermosulfidibacteraceae bacterium]|jgi:ADP-heptose:LPS heptosyltransferase